MTFSDNVLHLAHSYSDNFVSVSCVFFLKGSFNSATYVWPVVHKPGDRFKRSVPKLGKTAQKMLWSKWQIKLLHETWAHFNPFLKVPLWVNVQWKMYQCWTSSFKPFSSCGKLVLRQTWCFRSLDSQRWSHVLGYLGQQKYNGVVGCRGEALATNSGLDLVGSECLEANVNSNENMLEFREVQKFSIQLINFDFQVVNFNHPEKLVNCKPFCWWMLAP